MEVISTKTLAHTIECETLVPNRRTETQAQSAMDLSQKWLRRVVVVVVRMIKETRVSVHARTYRGGRSPGSQTPGVPAASTSRWTEAEKCCKTAANDPSSPPEADHAHLQLC